MLDQSETSTPIGEEVERSLSEGGLPHFLQHLG